jgi:hypothetical protein
MWDRALLERVRAEYQTSPQWQALGASEEGGELKDILPSK